VLGGIGPIAEVERELTLEHARVVKEFLLQHELGRVDLVGLHGHTILHRPHEGRTWQIGDGALLAASVGMDVVADFRSNDVAAGGEGAPLAPVFHAGLAARLERPLAVLNLGGVGNVTWLGSDPEALLAFDTGPGNALIDDWALRHTGAPFDRDGALAATGRVDSNYVERFLRHPFFSRSPPKSLDRDDFAGWVPHHLAPPDGAATLAAMTVAAVRAGARHFPAPVRRWLVTGGGRHNPTLMSALRQALDAGVEPVEGVGWQGDALEAQAFAYLAVRSRAGLPLSFPGTTGVRVPLTGGRHFQPNP
jgi:anhydro-N-acetylmuramic acid kinase